MKIRNRESDFKDRLFIGGVRICLPVTSICIDRYDDSISSSFIQQRNPHLYRLYMKIYETFFRFDICKKIDKSQYRLCTQIIGSK